VSADLVVSLRAVNPEFRKVALIAACLGLIVSVFFALQPDDEDDATATTAAARS
jgi:hypothetical protein